MERGWLAFRSISGTRAGCRIFQVAIGSRCLLWSQIRESIATNPSGNAKESHSVL